jgi:CDP-diacylglycerol---serine O-phosphatidyltransferase
MIKLFNLANVCTACNMLSGVIAIIFSLMGRIDLAPFAIFIGAFFDFLDGFIARKLKVSGEFGKQLDSLADMVTFGVAPGVFMMVILIVSINFGAGDFSGSFPTFVNYHITAWKNELFYGFPSNSLNYFPFIALFIPFMSLFRLAKFNIDTRQSESFIGLNTPANTIFFTTFPLVLASSYSNLGYPEWFDFVFSLPFLVLVIGGMSLMLISELPMFSFKFKEFGFKKNQIRYVFLIISVLLIFIIKVWSIPIIVILYMIFSLFNNRKLKKSL